MGGRFFCLPGLSILARGMELFSDSHDEAQVHGRFAGWAEHQDYFERVWAE
jgi:hypothetical protein